MADINSIKKQVYAMRNGIAADNLRKSGAPYRMIFGVNLPHLAEIAESHPQSADLASALWADTGTRESLMLATMLYPADQFSRETAERWAGESPSAEISDILCHRLLRRQPYAYDLALQLCESTDPRIRYTGLRLMFNLLPDRIDTTREYASRESKLELRETYMIARSLLDEISFITGD